MAVERDHGVDLLRFIACCAVVGIHTFTNGLTLMSSAAYYACGFSVPVFFMASGAFLLNRGGRCSRSYVYKKLCQLATTLVLWVFVVSATALICRLVLGVDDVATVLKLFPSTLKGTLFQSGLLSHCWFLWALAILYCLLPMLTLLTRKGQCVLFGALMVIGLVFQVASCLVGLPLESHVPQAFRVWIWLEYFLLGGLIYPRCKQRLRVLPCGVLLIVSTAAAVGWQLFAGSHLMLEASGATHAEYFYDGLPCLLWCVAFFAFCEALKPAEQPWEYLSSLTMGVYLLHKLLIRAIGHFVPLADVPWGSGLGFVVVLMLSFTAVGLLKKFLPKAFKLFCTV